MSNAFTPLAVTAATRSGEGSGFRPKVIAQANRTPAFIPFKPAPRPAPEPSPPPPASPHALHAGNPPKITLERDGDRVTHIRIACSCGEVFELVCDY